MSISIDMAQDTVIIYLWISPYLVAPIFYTNAGRPVLTDIKGKDFSKNER